MARFGAGRPRAEPGVLGVRELAAEELAGAEHRRGRVPALKRIRDSHHQMARLFASGLRPGQVAEATGYSLARISTLYADPALQDLIEKYRKEENASFYASRDEYYDAMSRVRTATMRQIAEQLDDADETGEPIPLRTLAAIHDSTADRTGYPKRSIAVNVNVDFAARLERAIKRSAAEAPQVQPTHSSPSPEGPSLPSVSFTSSSPKIEPPRLVASRPKAVYPQIRRRPLH